MEHVGLSSDQPPWEISTQSTALPSRDFDQWPGNELNGDGKKIWNKGPWQFCW